MRTLSDRAESDSIGDAFLKDGDLGEDSERLLLTKKLIKQANGVPLETIFKKYGLNLDQFNKKVTCPFQFHQNERSPSFYFYFDTNTFHCFGCKTTGGPVNFIASFHSLSKYDAAIKVIETYGIDGISSIEEIEIINFSEKTEILLNFSDQIRNFIALNNNEKSIKYAEKLCFTFDAMNTKHNLDNNALKSLVDKLIKLLGQYK